ncbi:DMT family transporter [Kitasatospora viridis]|uniref:DME family drug/metabolite transporter n=1 Tax=Kitasatospora viridis TaxID=281105 RepID=A0A561UN44_9ACTN|nr:DMT family transporter [Kitasatospora viridis]TWG00780.1 DME family drug/metabolite transporter [Kitasatospora viridis]
MSSSSVPSAAPRPAFPAGRGLLYLVLSAGCWGTAGAAAALFQQSSGLGPVAGTFWRSAVGVLLLLPACLRRGLPRRPDPVRLLVDGLGLTLFQIGYFEAVSGTGLAVATVVTLGAAPVLVAVGARPLLGERLGAGGRSAVAGAVAGLLVLVLGGTGTGTGGTVRAGGVGWALASAAGYACITLHGRRRGSGGDALGTTLYSFLVCALVSLACCADGRLLPHAAALPRSLALMLYLAAVPTALGYALYFTALPAVRATTAAVIALLEPACATLLATTLLGERLTPATVLGTAVLLLSVAGLAVAEARGRAVRPGAPRAAG